MCAVPPSTDHYGYERFDIVCQFDADHVPEPNYLTTLLPAFLDPEVRAAPAWHDGHHAGLDLPLARGVLATHSCIQYVLLG